MISNENNDSAQIKTLKGKAYYIPRKGVAHVGIQTVVRCLINAFGHLQTHLTSFLEQQKSLFVSIGGLTSRIV